MVHSSRESSSDSPFEAMDRANDQLNGESLAFAEEMFARYQANPTDIPESWQQYFRALGENGKSNGAFRSAPSFKSRSLFNPPSAGGHEAATRPTGGEAILQERVDQLIRNYRVRGHMIAQLNPLSVPSVSPPELDPSFYGFSDEHLDLRFSTSWLGGPENGTLREILEWLRNTYCRSIGAQFMHIDSLHVRQWLQNRMEGTENHIELSRQRQIEILTKLTDAVVFEEFLQRKYLGAKSFSLEGAESLIPLVNLAIQQAAADGVEEVVFGMAHRGRLNVLANIMGKSPRTIFREFEDVDPELNEGRGDVKYHLGYSGDQKTMDGKSIHLTLCFNPSHLEFVNPVALGRTRAKQDRRDDHEHTKVMTVLIHGDAAFAGEGIVQEMLNMSELHGYRTGGTLHVIVNNQIGFTTLPAEGRSTTYATDVARMLQIPIFHVNGEDPEAVAQVVDLAMDFRRTFQRDVVIDMYCYRLRGHNESDEPAFTQPTLYREIEQRESVHVRYREHLLELREVTRDEAEQIVERSKQHLEEELSVARSDEYEHRFDLLGGIWAGYFGGDEQHAPEPESGLPVKRLSKLLDLQTRLPSDFHPHPKIERFLKNRREMSEGRRPLDWAAGESLAFASLLTDGSRVRLSGQDCGRGTFSQRHAVFHDSEDGHRHIPLQNLSDDQGRFDVWNSPLNETGVLGFDYGYSLDCPDGLVIWEAQFGDFVNVAQVIIDQFITSGEDKWHRLSGIVMLLPHGFEGQGPEHSSARLERFLMLAAEDNIQVVSPSTPAQIFHVLRRQQIRKWRKPLIVMTPKSLLRHRLAVSSLDECAAPKFQRVIPDAQQHDPSRIRRVLLCTGKVYYDLIERREQDDANDIAIVRLEQIYPLPKQPLAAALELYPAGTDICWVQEEPKNMGAWPFLVGQIGAEFLGRLPLRPISRPASASPATGSATSHRREQARLVEEAFAP